MICVIPLGPGDPGLLTVEASELLRDPHYRIFLRTEKHPVSVWLQSHEIAYTSLDSFYDAFEDFDRMHEAMASHLWAEAEKGPVCFGVMDVRTDGAVSCLRNTQPEKGTLRILSGVGEAEPCLAALPQGTECSGSLQYFTAVDLLSGIINPSVPLMITEIDSPLLAGEIKLVLGDLYDDQQPLIFFPPSFKAQRSYRMIPLYQLDNQKHYDHTAAVFLPGVDYLHRARHTFEDLERIVSRLRAPDGCPWDSVQTHRSLTPYMVEEAWEVVNAIEEDDPDHLADELGDVLFQVFIHASIGKSCGEFTLTDILTNICRKMMHRHPAVFDENRRPEDPAATKSWEQLKRAETGSKTVGESLDDIPDALPSLKYAAKICKKLAQIPGLFKSSAEIAGEIRRLCQDHIPENGSVSERSMSQLLMLCAGICYQEGLDAEILLHRAAENIIKKYQAFEETAIQEGKSPENLTIQEFRVYWQQVME